MKYRKKPVVIEAYRYIGDCFDALEWAGLVSDGNGTYLQYVSGEGMHVHTKEGKMHVTEGDYIICGVKGEFYPCKPDIFEATYTLVPDSSEEYLKLRLPPSVIDELAAIDAEKVIEIQGEKNEKEI